MGVEVATFISDLQNANPGGGDLRSQGDDHIRLVKAVLQATFPVASKAWYNPSTASKNADFTVVAADMNKTFLIDTSGGIVNATLPTLVAGDAGWECFLIKTTTGTNPVLVKPPSGTLTSGAISGLSAARRCIPGGRINCLWTGSVFIISRNPGVGGPVGCAIENHVASLPVGYEWPSGQLLASAATNYPELNAVNGSGQTLDVRGRISVPLDNLGGSAANRITTAVGAVDGVTFGAVGGVQSITLASNQIPSLTSVNAAQAISVTSSTSVVQSTGGSVTVSTPGSGAYGFDGGHVPSFATVSSSANNSISVTYTNGAQVTVKNLPPMIVITKVLVVE